MIHPAILLFHVGRPVFELYALLEGMWGSHLHRTDVCVASTGRKCHTLRQCNVIA